MPQTALLCEALLATPAQVGDSFHIPVSGQKICGKSGILELYSRTPTWENHGDVFWLGRLVSE